MKKQLFGLYLIISVFIFSCTSSHKDVSLLLAEADSLVWTNADSALYLLESIPHPDKMDNESYAHYALLLTQARYRCYLPFTSDSLIDFSLEYYKSKPKDVDKLATAWYYKGALMKECNEPLESYILAYKEAESLIPQLQDQRLVARIYHSLGQINDNASCYDLAKEYYHKALKVNYTIGNLDSQVSNLTNLSSVYLMIDKKDSAEWCVKKLQNIVFCIKDTIKQRDAYHNMALCNRLLGNFCEAEKYYNYALNITNEREVKDKIISSLTGLYITNGKLNEADSLFNLLIDTKNFDVLTSIYYNSYLYAKENRNLLQIMEYADKYIILSDSLYTVKNNKKILEIQHDYEMTKLKYKNSQLQIRLIGFLTITLSLIGLLLAIYKMRQKKMYLHFIYLQNELLVSQEQELKNVNETNQLKIKLEDFNNKKEKELKALSNQYILLLEQKEKQMQSVEYSALQIITRIRKEFRYNPKTDREALRHCLHIIHPTFIKSLETLCPNLQGYISDVCYLTVIGYDAKDIMELLHLSDSSVRQYMNRLCKEAHLPDSGKKPFYTFINSLLINKYSSIKSNEIALIYKIKV